MKKIIRTLIITVPFAIASSCGVGSAVAPNANAACDARAKDYEAAVLAWTNDIGNANKCQAAKTAIEKLISTCTIYTVAQRKTYQDQLNTWKCN